jgi:hypothetical protein
MPDTLPTFFAHELGLADRDSTPSDARKKVDLKRPR